MFVLYFYYEQIILTGNEIFIILLHKVYEPKTKNNYVPSYF